MSISRGTITDARGRLVGFIEPTRTSLSARRLDELPRIVRHELRLRRGRRLVVAVFLMLLFFGVSRILVFHQISSLGWYFTMPLPLAGGMIVPIFFYGLLNLNVLGALTHRVRIRDAAVKDWVCPTCLYDLRGIPSESDGCTACPECGSAWRLPDYEAESLESR
jgi:hypothetical protein